MRLTTRVNAPVMPPGHSAVGVGSVASKRLTKFGWPVSLSSAKTVFVTPVTNDVGVKTCMPLAVTPCDSASP